MKLFIFDDVRAGGWAPFALTRPISELRYGSWLLRERLERAAGTTASGLLPGRSWLDDFSEEGTPPVMAPAELPTGESRILLSSRFVPDGPLGLDAEAGSSARITCRGRVVGCLLPPGAADPDSPALAEPDALPGDADVAVEGEVLDDPWDLVSGLADRLRRDLRERARESGSSALPEGVERVGTDPVLLGPGVRLEPGVVLDTRNGPVRLDRDVEVLAGARLEGPLHAGRGSRLLGGPLSVVAAGPVSYLRGEVEESVVLGHANKAHDGFLGHSLVGRWVNLGALTTNSDLKNNYGPVRMGGPDGLRETGLRKLGCFLGDHAKTAIGTLLGTGTVVGAGANVFGEGTPPRWIPPFAWGLGDDPIRYRREEFLETALHVMRRRDVEPEEATARWLGAVHDRAVGDDAS